MNSGFLYMRRNYKIITVNQYTEPSCSSSLNSPDSKSKSNTCPAMRQLSIGGSSPAQSFSLSTARTAGMNQDGILAELGLRERTP